MRLHPDSVISQFQITGHLPYIPHHPHPVPEDSPTALLDFLLQPLSIKIASIFRRLFGTSQPIMVSAAAKQKVQKIIDENPVGKLLLAGFALSLFLADSL